MENEKIIKQMKVNNEYFEIVDEQARNEIKKLKRYEIPAEWNEEHLNEAIRFANDGGAVFYSPENTYQLSLDSFKSYINVVGNSRVIIKEMKFIDFIEKKLVYTFKTTDKGGKNWELTTEDVPNSSGLAGVNLEWKEVSYGVYGGGHGINNAGMYFELDTPLEANKIYYVERYNATEEQYDSCTIKISSNGNNALEPSIMYCMESNTDTTIMCGCFYAKFGDRQIIYIEPFNSSNIVPLYQSENDYVKIYEQVIVNVVNPDNVQEFQEKLVAGEGISIEGNVISATGGGNPLIEVTYNELKNLRDGGQLVAGQQYCITDYETTTTQSRTKSAGHRFDIIVVADSVNTLNEVARARKHEGDTYFSLCDLSAWELKYSLDNDTDRFYWADEVNGKGVIYHLKDEWDNEVGYDFKNIIYFILAGFVYNQWGSDYVLDKDESLDQTIDGTLYKGYLSDKSIPGVDSDKVYIIDEVLSTDSTLYKIVDGVVSQISYGGTIKVINEPSEHYTINAHDYDGGIRDGSILDTDTYNTTYNNRIMPCIITKAESTAHQKEVYYLGDYELYELAHNNYIGYDSTNIKINSGSDNIINDNCKNIRFIGTNQSHNNIGYSCSDLNLFSSFTTIGTGCRYMNLDGVITAQIGNNCIYIEKSGTGYIENLIIENGVQYITFNVKSEGRNEVYNVAVKQGVKGYSDTNRAELELIASDSVKTPFIFKTEEVITEIEVEE